MLSAHIHSEYLQPLTPASVTIELDAKKSPLALLAQACSQIGKVDPPASSKESASPPSLKLGQQRPPSADKCSFKSYHKVGGDSGGGGEDQVSSSSLSDKMGFRVLGGTHWNTAKSPPYAPHPFSPSGGQGPKQRSGSAPPNPLGHSPNDERETGSPSSTSSDCGQSKKDTDARRPTSEGPHLANSGRSSDGGKAEPGHGCLTPISPYESAHPLIPLPPSNVVYHSSVVGPYAGYPPRLGPELPRSSPLAGSSPPFFMQGPCRDPYCLSYPNVPHHSSSGLKSSFPLVYAAHPAHPLYSYLVPSDSLARWESARGPCDKRFTASDELLARLRAHNAVTLEVDPKVPSSAPALCHVSHMSGSGGFLRAPHGMGVARYHPYSNKVHLSSGPSAMSVHSLPATSPYYPHYAFYNQRLGPPSTLGYQ
ncbi:zinc finger protein 703-like [Vanacampus margaritifer]